MRPEPWNPPIDLSQKEEKIMKLIKRAKLFRFLREIRHLLFDEEFQEELSKMYAEAATGHPPVQPEQQRLNLNPTSLYQSFGCGSHRSSDNGSTLAVGSGLSRL